MNTDNFTPEQAEKARNLSAEELVEFAEKEGIELTDEQMDAVNGGKSWYEKEYNQAVECPTCHKSIAYNTDLGRPNRCPYCGNEYPWGK